MGRTEIPIAKGWGQRRPDEPTPSQIERFAEDVKTHVVIRRVVGGTT